MKNTWLVLALFFFSVCLQAQTEKPLPVPQAVRNNIQKDAALRKATDLLSEFSASVDFSSGELYRTDDKNYSVKYKIKDPQNQYDYKSIVYVTENGKSFVFFEDKKEVPVADQSTQRLGCYWTSWSTVGTECHYNWWCGKRHNRQATYRWETRSKICGGVVKKKVSRLVKDHCGC